MPDIVITAEERQANENASQLRKNGWIPSVISSHGKTTNIKVNAKQMHDLFSHGISESMLIDVEYGGKKETAFIKDYQIHPVNDSLLHVDFFRITYGEKIRTNIPLVLVGKAAGIKEGGVLEIFLHELEIETFPRFLKPQLDIDISALKIGDTVFVADIELPPETKVLNEGNPIICQISVPARMTSEGYEETTAEEKKDTKD